MISVAPAVILILIFFCIPLILLFWMSLNNWPLLSDSHKFIGLQNYAEIFNDSVFHQALLFTIKFTIINTPIQLIIGYLLALAVRKKFRGVSIFRAAYFAPVVVGVASASYAFLILVQPESGLFDQILMKLGITDAPLPWLTNHNMAVFTVMLMTTWKTVGTTVILMMTGMQSISPDLYEAAMMDGASWWRRELNVTLPLLRPTIGIVLLLTLTGSFLAFDQFFVMTQGGPNQSTNTVVMWIYTTAFSRYRLGYSAAISILLLIIMVAFAAIQFGLLSGKRKPRKALAKKEVA